MKKLLFGLLLFTFACSKEDDDIGQTEVDVIECLGDHSPTFLLTDCDSLTGPIAEQICIIQKLEPQLISDESKAYIPFYCRNIGETLNYKSDADESFDWIITRKSYLQSQSTHTTDFICDNDSTKRTAYCLENEVIWIEMTTPDNSMNLTMTIGVVPDVTVEKEPGFGDFLRITRNEEGSLLTFVEFNVVLNKRTLTYDESPSQEFFPTITLNNTDYTNVISEKLINSSTFNLSRFKYYINQERGLIGFENLDGTLFTLQE